MAGKSLNLEIDLVRQGEPDETADETPGETRARDGAAEGADPAPTATPSSFDPTAFLDALHAAVMESCPGTTRASLDALLGGPMLQQAIETALLLDKPQGKA